MEVDDRLGALQALLEPGVFPLRLDQLSRQRIGLARFRAAPGRGQGTEGAGFALAAPVGQGRRIEPLAAQNGADVTGPGGPVGLFQDALPP